MDEESWCRWKHLAVLGKRDSSARHNYLTSAERTALEAVLAGPWMLEQEKIPLAEAERVIFEVFA